MYKEIKRCRACHSVHLKKYLDLGDQPLANSLGNHPVKYPLQVLFCEQCNLSQLSVVVNPDILYKDYPYHSSVSYTFKNHCSEMVQSIQEIMPKDLFHKSVIDIASNDGCLLQEFKKQGFDVLGIEPAKNLAEEANKAGIPTINGYWSTETSNSTHGVDVVTATNVFAHVDQIRPFLNAVSEHLRLQTKGIFVMEVPYLPNLIEGNQFDTIYHEHLSYFLLKPLNILFNSCGIDIFKVEKRDIHGGSIRVYASPYEYPVDQSVTDMLIWEDVKGFYTFNTYLDFSNNVEYAKRELKRTLKECKDSGKVVMGYGASAKGCNLLNICGIAKDEIIAVVDETPDKQGKVVPGIEIPIVPFDVFDVVEPDYILLLSWNFAKELMDKTPHHKERRGKYIVPIPKAEII